MSELNIFSYFSSLFFYQSFCFIVIRFRSLKEQSSVLSLVILFGLDVK